MNGLLVGRFQPFHLGHVFAIQDALKSCEKLWLCIGSTNVQLNFKNPFSVSERREMIESSISKLLERIKICEIPDVDDHKKMACTFGFDRASIRIGNNFDPILDSMTRQLHKTAKFPKKGKIIVDVPFQTVRNSVTKIKER